ncbi:hypothetical protein V499_09106 [Pseudogymnoascus sp. VKM F-103]|nr:hypothetical protein V499_09106 [Pseudogymnoascus sp. VKM F-103]
MQATISANRREDAIANTACITPSITPSSPSSPSTPTKLPSANDDDDQPLQHAHTTTFPLPIPPQNVFLLASLSPPRRQLVPPNQIPHSRDQR